MDGQELAMRFAYIVNKKNYCGPSGACSLFEQSILDGSKKLEVADAFKKFEGLIPYLSAIANKHGKQPFDYDVVEAYWIGNELLDVFTKEDMQAIVERLTTRGLPRSMATDLIERMPEGYVPHHNFNVFYVGVGNTSGKVPTTLFTMDNCRISWGKVLDVRENTLVVSRRPLVETQGKVQLGASLDQVVTYMPSMLTVEKNDIVALHWDFAGMVLSEEQLKNLETYTQKILDLRNRTW